MKRNRINKKTHKHTDFITNNSKKSNNTDDNLKTMLTIAREEYNTFFTRSQVLDTKIGIVLALYSIIFNKIFNIADLKIIITNRYSNNTFFIKDSLSIHLHILNIILGLYIIFSLLYTLTSKKTKFVPLNLFSESVLNYKPNEFDSNLLKKTYKNALESNNTILDKKNNIFNIACYVFIIQLLIHILLELL